MKLISFVILHYGDIRVTDRCVQSILQMDQQERIRIVLVDNEIESSDEKRKNLKDKYNGYSHLYVIQVRENGGFSYANNIGYAYAREKLNSDFILVLNNDIEFLQKDFIERLENAYQNNPCHVLGPDIIHADTKEHQNPMDTRIRTKEEAEYTIRMNEFALKWYPILFPLLYWRQKYVEIKTLKEKRKKEDYYNKVQTGIVPFGACLIFTPRFVREEYKAFEPETRFYYEEYILALRCQRKGYETVYNPEMKILHESGVATKESYIYEKKRLAFMMMRITESCRVYLQYLGNKIC